MNVTLAQEVEKNARVTPLTLGNMICLVCGQEKHLNKFATADECTECVRHYGIQLAGSHINRSPEPPSSATQMYCLVCGNPTVIATFTCVNGMNGLVCPTCVEHILTTTKPTPMVEGHDTSRKSQLLYQRLQTVIDEEQFGDMTFAEIIGTLELLKFSHLHRGAVHGE